MRNFFKIFLASLLALFVFMVLTLILFGIVVSAATSSSKPDIAAKSILTIDLSKQYAEQEKPNPLGGFIEDNEEIPSLYDLVSLLKFAKADSSIKGIYLKCNANANGFAASQEIRTALADFKSGGKFIYAYGDVISQGAYYVANVADKVYCNPKGMLEWNGLSSTLVFFKGTLERLKIEPQIFYAGKFKSATEPFREYKMTEANKLQTSVYLNDLYGQMLLAAAEHSGMDTSALHRLANEGLVQSGPDAVAYKLLNAVKYNDEVTTELQQKLNLDKEDAISFVSISTYAKGVDFKKEGSSKIALIVADGEIVDGKGSAEQIGSETFQKLIRKVRLDKSIKAVVLRVNSPGGSSLASEIILRELLLTKKSKPVVVSFGDVAASGGYYISCGADSIFAQPNTITGSIGVFALIPNMQNFLNDKLGMTFDRVQTGPYADMIAVTRPMNQGEKKFIQTAIDTIYHDFKSRVADGRKLSMTFVDSIAQGRVWTGERAMQIGLVDKLGGMQDAIDCATRMAKLKDYRIREYPEKKGFVETMLSSFRTEVKVKAIKEEIGEDGLEMFQQVKKVKAMFFVPQSRLPFEINIK